MRGWSCVLLAAVIAAVLVVPLVSEGSDAADLADAPEAKYVVDLGSHSYLLGGAEQTFDLLGALSDATDLDAPSTHQGIYIGGISTDGLPGWITVEKSYTGTMYEDFDPYIELVVDPAYAVPATDYWCYCALMGGILWTINVEVQDSDPTITPSGTYGYRLDFDTMGGRPMASVTHQSHNDSWTVDPNQYVPTRDGYEFVGWSTDSSGESILRGDITLDGVADQVVSQQLYAVWDEVHLVLPTMWDELAAMLSDPLVLLILAAGFLAVCVFIRNRNGGRY